MATHHLSACDGGLAGLLARGDGAKREGGRDETAAAGNKMMISGLAGGLAADRTFNF